MNVKSPANIICQTSIHWFFFKHKMSQNKRNTTDSSNATNSQSAATLKPNLSFDTYPEEKLDKLMGKCWTDCLVKGGAGFGIGFLVTLLFIRRMWPPILGSSFGLGVSYKECERNLQSQTKCEAGDKVNRNKLM